MSVAHRRLVFLLVTVGLVILTTGLYANHAWSTYHWARKSNPFTLKVGNNMSSSWQSHFSTAVSDWNASSVMNLTAVAGSSNKRCSAAAGTVQVCNGTYGNNGWLGLAQIWLSNGHISQGTAKMNDTYFNTSTYNNPNEKLHVVCQEVGHTFGLDHQSTSGASLNTCMDYFSNTGANANSTLTRPSVPLLFVIAALMSAVNGFHRPALESLTQKLVAAPDMPAVSALSSLFAAWSRHDERASRTRGDGELCQGGVDWGAGRRVLHQ